MGGRKGRGGEEQKELVPAIGPRDWHIIRLPVSSSVLEIFNLPPASISVFSKSSTRNIYCFHNWKKKGECYFQYPYATVAGEAGLEQPTAWFLLFVFC